MNDDPPIPAVERRRRRSARPARVGAAAAAVAVVALLGGCADETPTSGPTESPWGRLAVIAGSADQATLTIHVAGGSAFPVALPTADVSWIAVDGDGRLVLTLPDGGLARSAGSVGTGDVVWEPVLYEPVGPDGGLPIAFAVPDAAGGRLAAIGGTFGTGEPSRLVIIDPATGASRTIDLGYEAHGWAPAWLGADRLAAIIFETTGPRTLAVVDLATSTLALGPAGIGGVAASADGSRVATLDADGRTLEIWPGDRWPATGAGPAERLGLIEPPPDGIVSAMTLDPHGETLAVVWTDDELRARWVGLYRAATGWQEANRITLGADPTRAAVALLP